MSWFIPIDEGNHQAAGGFGIGGQAQAMAGGRHVIQAADAVLRGRRHPGGHVVVAADREMHAGKRLPQLGEQPLHREGYRGGTWVLLDYGCVAIHVFNEEARAFYGLERLWSDGHALDLTGVLTPDAAK